MNHLDHHCVLSWVTASELEAERIYAVCEELPPEFWPTWLRDDPVRLHFDPRTPGLMRL